MQETFLEKELIVADREMVESVSGLTCIALLTCESDLLRLSLYCAFDCSNMIHILRARQSIAMADSKFTLDSSALAECLKQEADAILEGAKEDDIAFLVVGDPFG